MVLGIGVDTVNISRVRSFIERSDTFYLNTFSDSERACGVTAARSFEYFAARFAAKEAVYKAVAHLTPKKYFDFRIIETLNHADGCPYVHINDKMGAVMRDAGIGALHISITTEDDYATAFVIACGLPL